MEEGQSPVKQTAPTGFSASTGPTPTAPPSSPASTGSTPTNLPSSSITPNNPGNKLVKIIVPILILSAIAIIIVIIVLVVNQKPSQNTGEAQADTASEQTTEELDEDAAEEEEEEEEIQEEDNSPNNSVVEINNPVVIERNKILVDLYKLTPDNLADYPELKAQVETWIEKNDQEYGLYSAASADAHMMLAYYYFKIGDLDSAYQYLEDFIANANNNTAKAIALDEIYTFAKSTGDTDREISTLERLIDLPDNITFPLQEWSVLKETYQERLANLRETTRQ